MLLGMLRDDLIDTHSVVGFARRIVQRGTSQPHVRTGVWICFDPVFMIQTTHEAEVFPEWFQRSCRFPKDETSRFFPGGKPAPLVDAMISLGQRHSVRRVNGTETPGLLLRHLAAHRFQWRQRESSSSDSLENRPSLYLGWMHHRMDFRFWGWTQNSGSKVTSSGKGHS